MVWIPNSLKCVYNIVKPIDYTIKQINENAVQTFWQSTTFIQRLTQIASNQLDVHLGSWIGLAAIFRAALAFEAKRRIIAIEKWLKGKI